VPLAWPALARTNVRCRCSCARRKPRDLQVGRFNAVKAGRADTLSPRGIHAGVRRSIWPPSPDYAQAGYRRRERARGLPRGRSGGDGGWSRGPADWLGRASRSTVWGEPGSGGTTSTTQPQPQASPSAQSSPKPSRHSPTGRSASPVPTNRAGRTPPGKTGSPSPHKK
jgi:hypothetical protein